MVDTVGTRGHFDGDMLAVRWCHDYGGGDGGGGGGDGDFDTLV